MPNGAAVIAAETIAQLILQYGPEFAQVFYKMFTQIGGPTDADWASLGALAAKRAKDQMLASLVRNGVDPNSDKGKILLGLV